MRTKFFFRIPILQIAFDMTIYSEVIKLLHDIPAVNNVIVEVGTPLIKKYGAQIIRNIRRQKRNLFIIADLKTLDVGRIEAQIAYEESANGAVVSGLAPKTTIEDFLITCKESGIWGFLDMLAVPNPITLLKKLKVLPNVVILHRSIDEEKLGDIDFPLIGQIKKMFDKKVLLATAGGMNPISGKKALESGANILIVGRYITSSQQPKKAIYEFLKLFSTVKYV